MVLLVIVGVLMVKEINWWELKWDLVDQGQTVLKVITTTNTIVITTTIIIFTNFHCVIPELPPTDPPFDICDISLCNFGTCVSVNGTATCVCNKACPFIEQPVCGSDNKTYSNLCVMDSEACEREEYINIKHNGPCGEWLGLFVLCSSVSVLNCFSCRSSKSHLLLIQCYYRRNLNKLYFTWIIRFKKYFRTVRAISYFWVRNRRTQRKRA
jgi:hypothetical protein